MKKKISYFLVSLCITSSFMLLKKRNFLEDPKGSISLRHLIEKNVKDYSCGKAGSRLTKKYKNNFKEKDIKQKHLTKYQQSIIDFARDSSYKNIKPYIKKFWIFFVFLILDIIFIFLWISYCCCCCFSCCLFRNSKPSKCCSCIFFLISTILNFSVIIFSIVVLGLIFPFFRRINGVGCSAFNFLDHLRYGLAPSYINHANEWEGIDGLIDILEYTEEQKTNIEDTMKTINITQNDKLGKCSGEFKEVESIVEYTNTLIEESFDTIEYEQQINDLENVLIDFDDADTKIRNDLYDALHDYINKHAKKVCLLVFSLTLVFSFLGLGVLCLYFFLEYNFFRIIYVFIWNISMLLMLLVFLLGIVFGIIGYVFKDSVQVIHYIISPANLDSDDPLIFDSNDEYASDIIDVCANKDGDFMEIIQENGQLKENIENWEKNRTYYQNKINNIDNFGCEEDEKKKLKENYEKLLDVVNISLNISKNLTNVKCRFVRNDKNIILNEINSGGNFGISLCSCSFLVGIFLGISIVAGIIFAHKYKFDSKIEDKNLGNATVINESSEDINKDNKEIKVKPKK